ncbi:ankyrin repeat protein [Hypoxylon crocopeplum]|nr:ankyrin repeat protein [Hypoxylon crocopeplum]
MDSNFDDSRLFSYMDAEIIDYITSLPRLPKFSHIIPLSSKYLAKSYPEDEFEHAVKSVEFASQLGIRVPHIQRTARVDGGYYCVMDRIPGKTLDVVWLELSWITSLRLAFELRHFVRRMRSAKSTSSGSLATGKCRSYYLDDSFGLPPRASSDQINAFLNFWANFVTPRQEVKKTSAEHSICQRPVFLSNRPFVFTHHDLAPRNIILDREGQLWLIDWDFGGFYPTFFEYAGMHNFISKGWNKSALWRWKLFAWIASGFYDRESRWLEIIRSRFTRFRPFRRFNMKANGYAAISGRPDNDVE